MLALLSSEQVLQFWPVLVQHMAARPESTSGRSPEWLYPRIMDGAIQAWALTRDGQKVDTILLTELVEDSRGRILVVDGAWGEAFAAHLDTLGPELEDVAVKLNLDAIEMEGRPGWERMLRPLGFKPERIVMKWVPRRPTVH